MTGTATTTGQAPSQPETGSSSASASATETTTTTLLGGEDKPADTTGKTDEGTGKPGADAQAKPGETDGKKPEEGKKPDDKSADDKSNTTPEPYADFKMPDGIEVDTALVEAATPILRELKLDQDQAQKLVDVFAAHQQKQGAAYMEQLKDADFALEQVAAVLSHQRESWGAALKADKEIGGKDFESNGKVAMRAIARFGSPELKAVLEKTGLGNHPELVRFCLKVGRSISEDTTTGLGNASQGGRKPTENVFYGDKAAN